jgi:hypothetical protein
MTSTEILTADEYRAQAAAYRASEQESWDRSDTDGFLSQWALSSLANTALYNAKVVEQGFATSYVIFDLAGKPIATGDDQHEGNWGFYYIVRDDADAERLGRFLTPSSAQKNERRIANDAAKGIRTGWVSTTAMRLDRRGVVVADRDAILAGDYEEIEGDNL